MSLAEDQKTALNFKKFLAAILPYIGGGGGHTIKDSDDTEMTPRAGLKFSGDLEVSDDSENDETEVAPHRLTSEELADICSPLPAGTANLPVLFDESGAEYVVGRYVNSQGKWKPVYKKTIDWGAGPNAADVEREHGIADVDKIIEYRGIGNPITSSSSVYSIVVPFTHDQQMSGQVALAVNQTKINMYCRGGDQSFRYFYITIQYTKTTDNFID